MASASACPAATTFSLSARLAAASTRKQCLLSRHVTARPFPRVTTPRPHLTGALQPHKHLQIAYRHFSTSRSAKVDSRPVGSEPGTPPSSPSPSSGAEYDDMIADTQKDKQTRTPWHREGSNLPPVRQRQRSAGAMTKGKLLTTPSRLLKLIIPLTTDDRNSDRKDMQPLALLVHPQQPLSYLERLIQAELPTITDKDGRQKIPAVHFKAEDLADDEIRPQKVREKEGEEEDAVDTEKGSEEVKMDGKTIHTGKISPDTEIEGEGKDYGIRGGPGEGGVESYSGAGRSAKDKTEGEDGQHKLVRWSTSTEIGDFIRDAARGKEFAVEIEGPAGAEEAAREIRVGVPSFNDRTYYLRTRLRKLSARIATMAEVKEECDDLARRSAKRVALGGFGGLVGWWVGVWYLTFQTSLGWDVMEPVTYLVGLSTLMGGYLWFLYHNREVSYRSALNLTVSRRQGQLYHAKGFDLNRWESLVQDANALRHEVRKVADEYDVEWDETKDEHDEKVTRALRRERETSRKRDKDAEEDEAKESEPEPEPEPEPEESKGNVDGKEAGKS